MKKISSSNTKAQILDAYDDLMKKIKEKTADDPKKEQKQKEEIKTVEKAQSSSTTNIMKDVSSIKNFFNEALDNIQTGLLREQDELTTIQEAIKIEKKNLEDLYGISTNTDSLAAIILAQKETKERR